MARVFRTEAVCDALFHAGLLLLVGFVLLLPVFPSGDGPVHIYYSQILARLAAHGVGAYGQVYFIRHLVQPYSLHYWWLIALEHVTTAAVAEKCFVATILLVTAFGFRFLARTLGSGAPAVSPWVLPLLLSWALASGFLNFCFAEGMLFFAYGFYLRYAQTRTLRELICYAASLLLLVLSHPVPLLLLLLLLGCELLLLLWARHAKPGTLRLQPLLLCLGLALLAFVFPILIADKAAVADSLLRDLRPHWAQVRAITLGYRLSMFSGRGFAGVAFTALLVVLAPVVLALLVRSGALGRLRRGESLAGDRLCAAAFVILLATIIFPASMNGSALFADRMVPLLWPLLLVCAASIPVPALRTRWSAAAMAATATSLAFAFLYLLPAARQQAVLTAAALPQGKRGLFLTPAPMPHAPPRLALARQVLFWGGARAFAAHDDILLNSPWMQLTIVPVGERPGAGLLRDRLPGQLSESPSDLLDMLMTHNAAARQALASADFLLYSNPSTDDPTLNRTLTALLPTSGWRCTDHGFYAVCIRASAP